MSVKKSRSPMHVTKTRLLKKSKSKSRSRSPKRLLKKYKSKSKSPYRIDLSGLHKFALSNYGYSSKDTKIKRHIALKKAIDKYGAHNVWQKLNLVSILSKNRSPVTSNVFTLDKNWVKSTYIHHK